MHRDKVEDIQNPEYALYLCLDCEEERLFYKRSPDDYCHWLQVHTIFWKLPRQLQQEDMDNLREEVIPFALRVATGYSKKWNGDIDRISFDSEARQAIKKISDIITRLKQRIE